MKYFELDTKHRQIYQRKKPVDDIINKINFYDDYEFEFLYRGCQFEEIETLITQGSVTNNSELGTFFFCKDISYCLNWVEPLHPTEERDLENFFGYIVKYNRDILSKQKGYYEYTEYVLEFANKLVECPAFAHYLLDFTDNEFSNSHDFINALYDAVNRFAKENNRDPKSIMHYEIDIPGYPYYEVSDIDTAVMSKITLESGLIDNIFISVNPDKIDNNDYDYNEMYFEKLQELEQLIKNYS
jgi:hypothetical protein